MFDNTPTVLVCVCACMRCRTPPEMLSCVIQDGVMCICHLHNVHLRVYLYRCHQRKQFGVSDVYLAYTYYCNMFAVGAYILVLHVPVFCRSSLQKAYWLETGRQETTGLKQVKLFNRLTKIATRKPKPKLPKLPAFHPHWPAPAEAHEKHF